MASTIGPSEATVVAGGATRSPRPARADAVRNRDRILAAAEEVFASEGISVPIDVVAERAGVGVGTLYRHFPTKEILFEAIVANRLLYLASLAHDYSLAEEPVAALFEFLHCFAENVADKHDLAEALQSAGVDIKSRCEEVMMQMIASVEDLRRKAAATGAIRNDLSAEDLVGMVAGACHMTGKGAVDDRRTDRVVDVICSGLRQIQVRDNG
jgi:AcrR family transcriptional regulator